MRSIMQKSCYFSHIIFNRIKALNVLFLPLRVASKWQHFRLANILILFEYIIFGLILTACSGGGTVSSNSTLQPNLVAGNTAGFLFNQQGVIPGNAALRISEGNVTGLQCLGNQIYVSSSLGVYFADTTKNYYSWPGLIDKTQNMPLRESGVSIPGGFVFSLLAKGSTVYAGGSLGEVYFAKSDGTSTAWESVTKMQLPKQNIIAITSDDSKIYIATNLGGVYYALLNGSSLSWTPLVTNGSSAIQPSTNEISSIAYHNGKIYVSYPDSIGHWNIDYANADGSSLAWDNYANSTNSPELDDGVVSLQFSDNQLIVAAKYYVFSTPLTETPQWQPLVLNNVNSEIFTMLVSDGYVYIGTIAGQVFVTPQENFKSEWVPLVGNSTNFIASISPDGGIVTSLVKCGGMIYAGTLVGSVVGATPYAQSTNWQGINNSTIDGSEISGVIYSQGKIYVQTSMNNVYFYSAGTESPVFLGVVGGKFPQRPVALSDGSEMLLYQGNIYAASATAGVYYALADGTSAKWSGLLKANNQVYPSGIFRQMSAGNDNIYVVTESGAYFANADGSSFNWQELIQGNPLPNDSKFISILYYSDKVYVGTYAGGVYSAAANGSSKSWQSMNGGESTSITNGSSSVFKLLENNGKLLAISAYNIYTTPLDKISWTPLTTSGIPGNDYIFNGYIFNNILYISTYRGYIYSIQLDILNPSWVLLNMPNLGTGVTWFTVFNQ